MSGLFVNLDLLFPESRFPVTPWSFRVDSGSASIGMSLPKAERLGLLRDADTVVELSVGSAEREATLQTVRIGRIAVSIPSLRKDPFNWPIVFYPNWPEKRYLLGLAGVVSDLSFYFDGTPTAVSEFGSVTITLRDRLPPAS